MNNLPKFYNKNGFWYCKNIFTEEDIELYNDISLCSKVNTLNDFLPNGLRFNDSLRKEPCIIGKGYAISLSEFPNYTIPAIIDENNTIIVNFFKAPYELFNGLHALSHSILIEFKLSDKEKCEYLLYCTMNMIEHLRHLKNIYNLETAGKNDKLIKNNKLPKELYGKKYNSKLYKMLFGLSIVMNITFILGVFIL